MGQFLVRRLAYSAIAIIAATMVGDWLRDRLDPRLRQVQ